ncbi:NUDIX hydrolase [Microbacterium sp. CJ88]|uniref:NUDIX hydrolase n=1 Tax=Microbacterium sp. CJ88 TaxID=3445672 RepID=UPI003F65E644
MHDDVAPRRGASAPPVPEVPDLPVAATVILVRDSAEGPEVLLIERPDRGSFPGAWVFPGGKVEESDAAGLTPDASESDIARAAGVRETREETGLIVDGADLVLLSRWEPPEDVPVRIRTWFLVGRAPAGEITLQPAEAVSSQWIRPADALDAHGRGELVLYPPTWVTLSGLADPLDADGLLAAARLGGIAIFATRLRRTDTGSLLLWSGDTDYDPETTAPQARHRLDTTALPWVYTRHG